MGGRLPCGLWKIRLEASSKLLGDAEPDSETDVIISFCFLLLINPMPQPGTVTDKKGVGVL